MAYDVEAKMNKLIDEMSDARQDQREEVVGMRKTLKAALLKKNLKEHPAIAQLLALLSKREGAYTQILSDKEDITELQRQGFIQRRKEVRFILSFFGSAERAIEGIDKKLDYFLSDEISPSDNAITA